jgi:hypothetical protein
MSIVQQINVVAMKKAVEAFVGPQVTEVISQLYGIIDQAMKDGYDLGIIDGEANRDRATAGAFDNGWQRGHSEGVAEGVALEREYVACNEQQVAVVDGYDEGYLDGVTYARAHPALADETVASIIAEGDQFTINGEFDVEEFYSS